MASVVKKAVKAVKTAVKKSAPAKKPEAWKFELTLPLGGKVNKTELKAEIREMAMKLIAKAIKNAAKK